MKSVSGIGLTDVQAVYSGAEGRLWELIMGEQIHIGGFASSMDLAQKAGSAGIDLCCCNGAGMRFLVRFREVAQMRGVDATPTVIQEGRERCQAEGLEKKIEFVHADVCASGLPDGSADFVWGEDAWCYVADKPRLLAEACRLAKPGGTVAFTDWVEGPTPMSGAEAERFLRFMKFPNLANVADYRKLLESNGCTVRHADNTGRFAPCVDLYLNMLGNQLTYDALKIIGFDQALFGQLAGEMQFIQGLAHQSKVIQGLFVGRKN